jgi:cytochrome c oxidase subunit 2
VSIELESADVIHSFWVPALAGKVDAIPGRTTRLAVEPTKTGVFMGACAEYCGLSHAKMFFHVKVVPRADFRAWTDAQAAPAVVDARKTAGARVFLVRGCGACHTVRGSAADGVIGPDLTHVGGRYALGAGILNNDPRDFRRWLVELETLKPGVRMPAFDMLSDAEVTELAAYLDRLE